MGWVGSPVLRRERARKAHARLSDAVSGWLQERAGRPLADIRRHGNPLKLLAGILNTSLARIGDELENLPPTGAAFGRCGALETQLSVVDRLWQHYRERLEQRDDPVRGAVLVAADHVVWSCFTGLGGTDPSAVPLPYIDPTSTPLAIPRAKAPAGLRTGDKLLADLLSDLPLPLVALPANVLDAPWWLVLLAHEVGHHLQYDLEPAQELVAKTGEALAEAAGEASGRWTPWRFELFADACSVVAVGGPAVRAIAELEWATMDEMSVDRAAYPPTIVRLATMCALGTELGCAVPTLGTGSWDEQLDAAGVKASVKDRIKADLARVPAVAKGLAELMVGKQSLRARFAVTAPEGAGAVEARAYLAGQPVAVAPGRRAARLAVGAAFETYQTMPEAEPDRGEALGKLRDSLLDLIARTSDGTTRAAPDLAAVTKTWGAAVDDRLRGLTWDGSA